MIGKTADPSLGEATGDLVVSLDIGSTFTKGAVFRREGDRFAVIRHAAVPTTVGHLPDGVLALGRRLLGLPEAADWSAWPSEPPVFFSSSAKGGLRVVVVGLVPELSLQIGRLAAWSAGARITAAFSYRLSEAAAAQIEREGPDIVLLCGGTDGGHERTGRENAQILARSGFSGTILYAGNAAIADDVRAILSNKNAVVVDNVMPDFAQFHAEPAREMIREIFLRDIVRGKGLDVPMRRFGAAPAPTPRAMFDLIGAMADHCPGWDDFAVIDLGGATTDVYSCAPAFRGESQIVLRGIVEPERKRSVEGDLGLRISVSGLWPLVESDLRLAGIADSRLSRLADWVRKVQGAPATLPATRAEADDDAVLAAACVRHAMRRHAGRLEPAWTPEGRIWLQSGKDLRPVSRVVLTGGYPAANSTRDLWALAWAGDARAAGPTSEKKIALVPRAPECFTDARYLWPLLGNLAARFPAEAARTAVSCLIPAAAERSCTSHHVVDKETVPCEHASTSV